MNFGSNGILIITLMYVIMLVVKANVIEDKMLSESNSTAFLTEDLREGVMGVTAIYRPKRLTPPCWPGKWRRKMDKCIKIGAATKVPCAMGQRGMSGNCKILSNVIIAPIRLCRPGRKMRLNGKCTRVWAGEFNINLFLSVTDCF